MTAHDRMHAQHGIDGPRLFFNTTSQLFVHFAQLGHFGLTSASRVSRCVLQLPTATGLLVAVRPLPPLLGTL